MVKATKAFNIHDEDVTPEIYTLLFCGAFVEIMGNDMWYMINPFANKDGWNDEWEVYNATEYQKSAEEKFSEKLKRGWHNCYHDMEAMKHLCENPCTCAEAITKFKAWLSGQGVTGEDDLFVKIWW
jgi:hypothetical protein